MGAMPEKWSLDCKTCGIVETGTGSPDLYAIKDAHPDHDGELTITGGEYGA